MRVNEAERVVYSSWTEQDLDDEVRRLCRIYRWRYYHSFLSIRSTKGFPDLCLVRAPRVAFVELKRQGGRLTQARLVRTKRGYPRWVEGQREWLCDLTGCPGVETYVWWPQDVADIATILDAGPTEDMACVQRVAQLLAEEDER
jgi:hypothetical protein